MVNRYRYSYMRGGVALLYVMENIESGWKYLLQCISIALNGLHCEAPVVVVVLSQWWGPSVVHLDAMARCGGRKAIRERGERTLSR